MPANPPSRAEILRIVAWNIRAGGGRRADAIVDQIARWQPDAVALSEFRGTPPSRGIAEALGALGLVHQRATADARDPRANALLVAARWPVRRVAVRRAPEDRLRWLLTRVAAPPAAGGPFALGALHAPNFVTGRKLPFLDAVAASVRAWRGGAALLVGDTNTGRAGVDEQTPVFDRRHHEWMEAMHRRWPDAHRHLHGDEERAFTWYSPNGGNGFRLDEAFVAPTMLPRLRALRHEWGSARDAAADAAGRRDALSDHAALVIDFALPRSAVSYRPAPPARGAAVPEIDPASCKDRRRPASHTHAVDVLGSTFGPSSLGHRAPHAGRALLDRRA